MEITFRLHHDSSSNIILHFPSVYGRRSQACTNEMRRYTTRKKDRSITQYWANDCFQFVNCWLKNWRTIFRNTVVQVWSKRVILSTTQKRKKRNTVNRKSDRSCHSRWSSLMTPRETRLIETLENVCERFLQYNVHAERPGSLRYARGRSQTMETLWNLRWDYPCIDSLVEVDWHGCFLSSETKVWKLSSMFQKLCGMLHQRKLLNWKNTCVYSYRSRWRKNNVEVCSFLVWRNAWTAGRNHWTMVFW